jgi:hypothetical protein
MLRIHGILLSPRASRQMALCLQVLFPMARAFLLMTPSRFL